MIRKGAKNKLHILDLVFAILINSNDCADKNFLVIALIGKAASNTHIVKHCIHARNNEVYLCTSILRILIVNN